MRSLALLVLAACGSTAPSPRPPTEPPLEKPAVSSTDIVCSDSVHLRGTKQAGACNSVRATPTDEAKIDEDIRELYKTGLFEDVVAIVENGTVLVYELRDRGVIAKIDVINPPPGLTLPKHDPNGLADPVLIRRNAVAMREALRDAGYRSATVEHKLSGTALTYTITAGTRTVVGEVKFKGLDPTREAAFRKQLTTQLGQPVRDDETQRDLLVLQTALFEEGLLASRLSHEIVDAGEAKVDLVFTIEEGPVFKLGAVAVKGPKAKDAKAYRKALAPLKKGTVARRSLLVAAIQAIEAIHAGDQPVPTVIPQTNVQVDKKLVDVDFVVE